MHNFNGNRPTDGAVANSGKCGDASSQDENYNILSVLIRVGRRTVGEVRFRDCTFQKTIAFSRHLLRKPEPAVCNDVQALDDAEQAGAVWAEVTDSDSGAVYRTAMATIREHGRPVNYGYGAQLALPLRLWQRIPKSSAPSSAQPTGGAA